VGGNSLSIPVMITGRYIWIVLCRHQTAAHMQICLHFLCQKKEEKKENYFYVVDDFKKFKAPAVFV
jgi:hypothetical protein